MKPKLASSAALRAAVALDPGAAPLTMTQVDELLTECAGAQLSVLAEIRRVDRCLHSVYETAAAGLGTLAQGQRLVDRSKELAGERSRLARLISELRERRDRLATRAPPSPRSR